MSFLVEVVGNLVGAGVGAFLGYLLGVRQEKKSRIEREESRITAMIKSIVEEINYNSDVIGDKAVIDLRSSVEDKEVLTHDEIWINELSTAILESVMSSGNFSMLYPDLQVSLSNLLMELKKVNIRINRIELLLPMKKNQLLNRKKQIDDSLKNVLSWIDLVIETMREYGYLINNNSKTIRKTS